MSASTTLPACAFSRVMKDERKEKRRCLPQGGCRLLCSLGVKIERVMTDNGSCYRSRAFAKACRRLGLKHIRTRPYTPKTNGKAERFIQTALREWAYARAYLNSDNEPPNCPMASPLQLASTSWQYRRQATYQPDSV